MILSLSRALNDAGFDYAGEILNLPSELHPSTEERWAPAFSGADILVLPTRPPLDDDRDDRRSMAPSSSQLEAQVFAAMRRVFVKLDRGSAKLSQNVTHLLPADQKDFSEIHFQINGGASIVQCGTKAKLPNLNFTTVAYLATVLDAVEPGVRLIAAFAMGGVQTYLWGQILREQPGMLQEFITGKTNRLVMGAFRSPEENPRYPYFCYKPEELQYWKIADIAF